MHSSKVEIVLTKEGGTYAFDEEEVYVLYSQEKFAVKGIHPRLLSSIERLRKIQGVSLILENITLRDPFYLEKRLKMKKDSLAYLSSLNRAKKEDFLRKAERRAQRSRNPQKDVLYYSLPFYKRPFLLSPSFRKASRRNEGLKKYETVDLLKAKQPILESLNGFWVGILGEEDLPFIARDKTIGENLSSILLGVDKCPDPSSAREEAIALLNAVHIPRSEEILDYKFHQFINEDYQTKILLSYLLAFSPKLIVIDHSNMSLSKELTDEITSILLSLMKKRHFCLVLYDDVLFDKDFKNKHVDVLTKEGKILSEEEFKENNPRK